MKDIEIRELFRNKEKYGDREVVVHGWVRGNRSSNQFGFLSINDGTFFTPLQVVYEADNLANFTEISKVHLAAGVTVRGTLALTPESSRLKSKRKKSWWKRILSRITRCRRSVIPWNSCVKSRT